MSLTIKTMFISSTASFMLMIISASALPLLAFLALLLRRNIFKGKFKIIFLGIGLALLSFAIYDTFKEHSEDLGFVDGVVALITAGVTLFILSHFNHNHTQQRRRWRKRHCY